ncbi:hypothetical protein SAMN05216194_105330 [Stutzerimonas kunmingensis]|uniref:hypothetical protein n=1 Tax=Pseudomonadaceae TaxID=135621 RepID=UPI0008EB1AD0|nr:MULTISPECIES: hypothetical protein [Pseudomonadaceae]MCQ2043433.1 hypothetical protein [Stutzerimonas kunmingensis]SFJ73685.1 hypothetical protein SAMN05216194_105330 [Stutzerimonas kunmingensis]
MQSIELSNTVIPKGGSSNENASRREVLKLSDLDSESLSDLAGMFGMWKEADHCDKDDR